MSERYLLDTDILVEYLRGSAEAAEYIEEFPGELLMSTLSVAELWSGVKGEDEERALGQFVLAFRLVPVDEELAKEGGLLRRQYHSSHGTGLADAIVAATALREKAKLITFNVKHYPMIEDISIPYRR